MQTLFKESQKFKQIWIWALLIPVQLLIIWLFYREYSEKLSHGITNILEVDSLYPLFIVLIINIILILTNLKTEIREDGFYYKYFPIHLTFRCVLWKDLKRVSVGKYNPIADYLGWGLKVGPKGWCYTTMGNMGLHLYKKNGKKLLIGTQQPEEINKIINNMNTLSTENNAHFPKKSDSNQKENKVSSQKFMKQIEIYGILLTITGILFKMVDWPFSGIILTVSLSSLAFWYVILQFMPGATKSNPFFKFLSLGNGLFLSNVAIGVLFKIQNWPYGDKLLILGGFHLLLIFTPILILKWKKTKDKNEIAKKFFRQNLARNVITGIFAFLIYFIPSSDLDKLFNRESGIIVNENVEGRTLHNH